MIDSEVAADMSALFNREGSRGGEGDGDLEGRREDWEAGDMGVLRPEENEDSDSCRKKGEVRSSGIPSSSAYRSCEILA